MSQLALDLGHRPALQREDFLVAPGNALAVDWIDRWPDWPAPALTIWGPAGAGKTHLAQVWRARSGAAETVPEALDGLDPGALLASTRAIVVEGVDRALANGTLDQRALLHLYNLLGESHGHLLLTANRPPARWPLTLPDLRSRLAAAPSAELGAPDDALLAAVLVKLFADHQLRINEEIVRFVIARVERSFAALRALVEATDRAALAERREITIPLLRRVLAELADHRATDPSH